MILAMALCKIFKNEQKCSEKEGKQLLGSRDVHLRSISLIHVTKLGSKLKCLPHDHER